MNESVNKIIKHPAFIPSVVGVVSFGAGAALGYFIGIKRPHKTKTYFHEVPTSGMNFNETALDEKAENAPEEKLMKETIPAPPVIIDEEVYGRLKEIEAEIFVDNPPNHLHELEEPEVVITIGDDVIRHTIFAENDEDWDHQAEVASRNPLVPYIIHKDEFYAEEMAEEGFTQKTLSYYASDKMMCDEEDEPVYNHDQIVGPLRFGHGSAGDPNVFYVRNEKHRGEYEIILNNGYYSVEVLGNEIEDNERAKDLKHSSLPRFRDD